MSPQENCQPRSSGFLCPPFFGSIRPLATHARWFNLLSYSLILSALCCIASRPAVSQSSADVQLASRFRAGQSAMQTGDFAQAAEEFKRVLALDPGLAEAEINLGLAYHSLGEYNLAAHNLSLGLQQKPELVTPTVIAGVDYLKSGSPQKAVLLLDHALKLDPKNREAREALASAYLNQQDFGAATQEFHKLADLDPDKAESWFKLGHEYLDISARLAYRGARLYPDSAWGHRFLGDLLFQRSLWNESAREYGKALAADPKQSGLHTSLGEAYLHAGKVADANAEFHKELDLDPGNESAWLGLAELAIKEEKAGSALEAVSKVWQISPEFLSLQREFPTVELSADTAKRLITEFPAQPSNEPAAHFLLATLYGGANQPAQADEQERAFRAALMAWQSESHHTRTASSSPASCQQHRYSDCADLLRARKELTAAQRLTLGKTLVVLRRYDEAAAGLSRLTGVSRDNDQASYWLALSYRALGAHCYAKLEEQYPHSWRTHQLRGEGYALRNDLDNAIKEFQAAIHLQPNSAELHEALGDAYMSRQRDDDAQKELQKAVELNPSRARVLYLLGRLYIKQRENQKAIAYLRQALRIDPDLMEANSLLGSAYIHLEQFSNAIPELQKAAPSDHYGNVHYQLFVAYRKLGQSELAKKALARSQELRRSSLEHDEALVMGENSDAVQLQ